MCDYQNEYVYDLKDEIEALKKRLRTIRQETIDECANEIKDFNYTLAEMIRTLKGKKK